jgi:hypothetical protein
MSAIPALVFNVPNSAESIGVRLTMSHAMFGQSSICPRSHFLSSCHAPPMVLQGIKISEFANPPGTQLMHTGRRDLGVCARSQLSYPRVKIRLERCALSVPNLWPDHASVEPAKVLYHVVDF